MEECRSVNTGIQKEGRRSEPHHAEYSRSARNSDGARRRMTTKTTILRVRVVLWLVVVTFTLLSVAYGVMMGRLFYLQYHPQLWPRDSFGPLWCGNTVTAPLVFLLSRCAPPAVLAGGVLLFLAYRGHGSRCGGWTAEILAICVTGALVGFGLWFFLQLPGFHLADQVWWMVRL